jgi:hypothetical protein
MEVYDGDVVLPVCHASGAQSLKLDAGSSQMCLALWVMVVCL